MSDAWIDKRAGWLTGQIRDEILTMNLQRKAWREVAELLDDNAELPDSYWWELMAYTYAHTQAMAVRRQGDRHRDAVSLANVIHAVVGNPGRITQHVWLGLLDPADPDHIERAAERWDEEFAREDLGAMADRDLARLVEQIKRVTAFADRYVAHTDARAVGTEVTVTFTDVHDAIDVVGELFRRYHELFTARGPGGLVPVIPYDWKAVFRQSWMRRSKSRRHV